MRLRATLIAIPGSLWESFPADRPLSELAGDLAGAERRIRKGVNARLECRRFRQLSDHVERSATELLEMADFYTLDSRSGLLGQSYLWDSEQNLGCMDIEDASVRSWLTSDLAVLNEAARPAAGSQMAREMRKSVFPPAMLPFPDSPTSSADAGATTRQDYPKGGESVGADGLVLVRAFSRLLEDHHALVIVLSNVPIGGM